MNNQEMSIRAEMTPVGKNNLVAVGSVYLNEMFVINNVKLINKTDENGRNRPVLSLPSRKRGEDWEKIVKVKDQKLYERICEEAIAATKRAVEKDLTGFDLKIQIRPYEKGETRGYATLVINDAIQIENVRICEKDGKLTVYYPYEKNGEYYQNLAGPAMHYIRQMAENRILEAYREKVLEQEKEQPEYVETPSEWEEKGPVR